MMSAVVSVDFDEDLTCRELCCIIFDERFSFTKSYIRNTSDIMLPENLTSQDILARELNGFLNITDKIFVWDSKSADVLMKIFSYYNEHTRHITVVNSSPYNPYKNMTFNELSEQSVIDMTDLETEDKPLPLQKLLCTAYYKFICKIYKHSKLIVRSNSGTILAEKTAVRSIESKPHETDSEEITENIQESDIDPYTDKLREVTEFCRENNMICRIDYNTVFIKTSISEWYFEIKPGKLILHHENFRKQKGAVKYGDGFHIQKEKFTSPLSAVKYIHKHDTQKIKRFW